MIQYLVYLNSQSQQNLFRLVFPAIAAVVLKVLQQAFILIKIGLAIPAGHLCFQRFQLNLSFKQLGMAGHTLFQQRGLGIWVRGLGQNAKTKGFGLMISPLSKASVPVMQFSKVVLPCPLVPTRAIRSLSGK